MGDVTLLAVFLGGLVSFFSPCVLPLVPAYLSVVSGVSVDELRAPVREQRLAVLRGTALFMGGFTLVFVLLGAGASAIGGFLLQNRTTFERIAGVIVIVMGLFLIGLVRPMAMERERRFTVSRSLGGWAAPVLGMAFAFGWTPCIGPVLAVVLNVAAGSGDVGRGMALLFVYSLGLAVPFLLSGLALNEMSHVFGWVKRHFKAIEVVSGGVLVVFGILMITGQVSVIAYWMLDVFERVGIGLPG